MHNATKNLLLTALTGVAMAAPVVAQASCWEAASQTYGIPVEVLKAVAKTESNFNAAAKNKNTNGSYDIGLMQINSAWLPKLETYGISENSLKDACTNLKVGAWILSGNAKKLGWNWNAIGAYNVGCAKLDSAECDRRRSQYAWKVHAALRKVTDIKAPMSAIASATYEQGATQASTRAIQAAVPAFEPKKIMVVKLGVAEASMKLAKYEGPTDLRGLNVDGFMAYEGAEEDDDE